MPELVRHKIYNLQTKFLQFIDQKEKATKIADNFDRN